MHDTGTEDGTAQPGDELNGYRIYGNRRVGSWFGICGCIVGASGLLAKGGCSVFDGPITLPA